MTPTHRIGTSIALALTLALAAGAAPAEARQFDLNANGSYVPAGLASMQAPSQPAAPPTSTQPHSKIASTGPCSEACSGGGYGPRTSRPAATPTGTGPGSDVSSTNGYDLARVPPTVVRIIPRDSGFDWGDASIGAGAALGLVLAATGGTLLLAHRRTQSRTAS
jgi:hypothetical protein